MKKILKQDNFILGLIIGAVMPWIPFAIIYFFILHFFPAYLEANGTSTIQLVVIVLNVVVMRQYMVKLKYDKTGRGLLFVTFIYILAYAVNEFIIK